MGLFRRRSLVAKRSTDNASPDVGAGRHLLEVALSRRAELVGLSPVADAVFTAATCTARVEAGSPLQQGLVDAALVGYACRPQPPPGAVPEHARLAIEARLARHADGRVDYER